MAITKFKIFGLVMGIGLFLFMATPALAYDTFPLLICGYENAPAGEFCTVCDTFAQIQHLLNFLFFYLVPVAATVLFIYGGFLVLLGGATPSTVQQGYGVFRKTAYGLFIIYGAWLIINFTLKSLSPADSPARNWWNFEIECRDMPDDALTEDKARTETEDGAGVNNNLCRGTGVGEVCSGTLQGRQLTDGLSCQPVNPGDGCDAAVIDRDLAAAIQTGAGNLNICSGVDATALLKAIVANESNGRIDIGSDDGLSSGPFQLTPDTGRQFASACGVDTANLKTNSDWFGWYRSSANLEKQACLAAKFLQSLASPCGCDTRQLAAGYNGGGAGLGACNVSTNCGPAAATDGGQ